MDPSALLSATLGLSTPWQIATVGFARETNRLNIILSTVSRDLPTCPACGERRTVCYLESGFKSWRHEDFLGYCIFLHARIPHLTCLCGVTPLEIPWCREGSKFVPVIGIEDIIRLLGDS